MYKNVLIARYKTKPKSTQMVHNEKFIVHASKIWLGIHKNGSIICRADTYQ